MFASAPSRLDFAPFAPTADLDDKLSDATFPFLNSLSETMNNAYAGRSSDWGRSAQDERFSNLYSTPRAEGTRAIPSASSPHGVGSYGAGATHEALYATPAESSIRTEHFSSPHGMMSSPPLHQHTGFAHHSMSPQMVVNHDAFSESHVRSQTAPSNPMGASAYAANHYPGHSSATSMYVPSQQGHVEHQPAYRAYDGPHGGYGNAHSYTSAVPAGMHPYASAVSSLDYRHHYLNPFEVKHRRRTTKSQFHILEGTFKEIPKPNAALRKALSVQLDMPPRAVQIWFQNRRAKAKATAKKEAAAKENGEGTPAEPSSSSSSSLPQSHDGSKREAFPRSLSDASLTASSSLLSAYSNQASSSSSTASDDGSIFQPQRVALTTPIQQHEHRFFDVPANEAWQYPNGRPQPYDNSQIYPSGLAGSTDSPIIPVERRASCPDVMPDLPTLPREHW